MKRILSITAVCCLALVACTKNLYSYKSGEQFVLPVAAVATMDDNQWKFHFQSVVTDSRCPTNVQCVWAGVAKIQCTVEINNSPTTFFLHIPSYPTMASDTVVYGKKIALISLNPYPQAGLPIAHSNYRATFLVTPVAMQP